jgi:pimeloyl-ACP methyl ester carboxylesterase
VAVLMAVRHPELVRRVAIYGSVLRDVKEVIPPQYIAEFMNLTPDHRSIQFEREAYERVAPDPSQWPRLFAKSRMAAGAWAGLSRDDLKSITAPVLIAAGDHDILVPPVEHHLEMSRLIPNAQLAVIPDAGHFVLHEDPEKLLPIIASFLDRPASRVPFATTISGYHPGETR